VIREETSWQQIAVNDHMGIRAVREIETPAASCGVPVMPGPRSAALHVAANARSLQNKRAHLVTAVIALVAVIPGCTVTQNLRRTLIQEPLVYSWKRDRGRSIDTYRVWADEAWSEHSLAYPDLCGDDDYALGFRDGFVDYVYAGGSGDPPPVPPRHFWNVDYRSPEGHSAAAQWFAGYRHGAAVARDGGYRASATLKSSLRYSSYHSQQDYARPQPALRPQPAPLPNEIVPAPSADTLTPPQTAIDDAPQVNVEEFSSPPQLPAPSGPEAQFQPEHDDAVAGSAIDGDRDVETAPPQGFEEPSVDFDKPSIDLGPFPNDPGFDARETEEDDPTDFPFPDQSSNYRVPTGDASTQRLSRQQRQAPALNMPAKSESATESRPVVQSARRNVPPQSLGSSVLNRRRSQTRFSSEREVAQRGMSQQAASRALVPAGNKRNARVYQIGPSANLSMRRPGQSYPANASAQRTVAVANSESLQQNQERRAKAQLPSVKATDDAKRLHRRDTLMVSSMFGGRPSAFESAPLNTSQRTESRTAGTQTNESPSQTKPIKPGAVQSGMTARSPVTNNGWQFVR